MCGYETHNYWHAGWDWIVRNRNAKKQVGFNDSVDAYIYAVLLTASLLFMMEAIMLMVRVGRCKWFGLIC